MSTRRSARAAAAKDLESPSSKSDEEKTKMKETSKSSSTADKAEKTAAKKAEEKATTEKGSSSKDENESEKENGTPTKEDGIAEEKKDSEGDKKESEMKSSEDEKISSNGKNGDKEAEVEAEGDEEEEEAEKEPSSPVLKLTFNAINDDEEDPKESEKDQEEREEDKKESEDSKKDEDKKEDKTDKDDSENTEKGDKSDKVEAQNAETEDKSDKDDDKAKQESSEDKKDLSDDKKESSEDKKDSKEAKNEDKEDSEETKKVSIEDKKDFKETEKDSSEDRKDSSKSESTSKKAEVENEDSNSSDEVKIELHKSILEPECAVEEGEPLFQKEDEEEADKEVKAIMDKDDDDDKPLKEPEVVELSDDEEDTQDDSQESEDDLVGDPNKEPGADTTRYVDPDHLVPFRFGWRREVIKRKALKSGVTHYDIFYLPPENTKFRTREAKRKRTSKMDQDKYFEDFPHETLSILNFNYIPRPLGMNNAAYEIVRKPKPGDDLPPLTSGKDGKKKSKKSKKKAKGSYREVGESKGLMLDDENSDHEDKHPEAMEYFKGFDVETSLTLQLQNHLRGRIVEHKKRRRHRDPDTCCTPPLAEDMLWNELYDDPMGVYNDMGGRSSPQTPPPLRALKVTHNDTAKKIIDAIQTAREQSAKTDEKISSNHAKAVEPRNGMVSHDRAIKKFRNYVEQTRAREPPQQFRGSISSFNNKYVDSKKKPGDNNKRLSSAEFNIKVKLPMVNRENRRPVVELVMEQNGRYQPIKFSNSMQITENVPRSMFEQANVLRKTVYLRATQVPRVGNKPLFLAINPSHPGIVQKLMQLQPSSPTKGNKPSSNGSKPSSSSSGKPSTDQVSILVKSAKNPGSKPVLLNVPRNVALKVKAGTTLSFSASNDQKYTVIDNKIHPPVNTLKKAAAANKSSSLLPQKRPSLMPAKKPSMFGGLIGNNVSLIPTQPPPTKVDVNDFFDDDEDIEEVTEINDDDDDIFVTKHLTSSVTIRPVNNSQPQQQQPRRFQQRPPMQQQQRQRPKNNDLYSSMFGGGGVSLQRKLPSVSIHPQPQKRPFGGVPMGSYGGGGGGGGNSWKRARPSGGGGGAPAFPKKKKVLSSGEVVSQSSSMTPCSPYCPGVTGFPELECTSCKTLFHSKCVGILPSFLPKVQSTFRCKMCLQSRPNRQPTVINLD